MSKWGWWHLIGPEQQSSNNEMALSQSAKCWYIAAVCVCVCVSLTLRAKTKEANESWLNRLRAECCEKLSPPSERRLNFDLIARECSVNCYLPGSRQIWSSFQIFILTQSKKTSPFLLFLFFSLFRSQKAERWVPLTPSLTTSEEHVLFLFFFNPPVTFPISSRW